MGKNLQDHILTGLDMITIGKSLGLTFKDFISPINIYKYFFEGTGKIKRQIIFKINLINTNIFIFRCLDSSRM